jgi:transposase, IS6 family
VILWAVRWYLMFPISYRDLELMLLDRGVEVDHTTIFRWIQAYAAELEKRIRPHLRRSNGSWRVDETYVKVKGRWIYLIEPSTAEARRSTFCSRPSATPRPRSGSFARRWCSRTR